MRSSIIWEALRITGPYFMLGFKNLESYLPLEKSFKAENEGNTSKKKKRKKGTVIIFILNISILAKFLQPVWKTVDTWQTVEYMNLGLACKIHPSFGTRSELCFVGTVVLRSEGCASNHKCVPSACVHVVGIPKCMKVSAVFTASGSELATVLITHSF